MDMDNGDTSSLMKYTQALKGLCRRFTSESIARQQQLWMEPCFIEAENMWPQKERLEM